VLDRRVGRDDGAGGLRADLPVEREPGVIVANKRHLLGLDELQQRIQLEAMALSLGVGLVAGLAYSNLDVANLIPGDAEISNLVILISLTYAAGIVAGQRKYR
jgi:hypothetical protein